MHWIKNIFLLSWFTDCKWEHSSLLLANIFLELLLLSPNSERSSHSILFFVKYRTKTRIFQYDVLCFFKNETSTAHSYPVLSNIFSLNYSPSLPNPYPKEIFHISISISDGKMKSSMQGKDGTLIDINLRWQ